MSVTADIETQALDSSVLPSLPQVAVALLQLSRDPDVTTDRIAECVSADPALVEKILRTVNSPLYALRHKVSTISRAAGLLGLNTLKGLVLGFSLLRDDRGGAGDGFSMTTFWRYALTSAVAARLVAARVGYADPEEAFIGGLLQDIGVLALHRAAPEPYAAVLAQRRDYLTEQRGKADLTGVADILCRIEREVLGTDHARVGGLLCERWGLPDILSTPVGFHHAPEDLDDPTPRVLDLTRILTFAALVGQTYNIAGKRLSVEALHARGRADFGLRCEDVAHTLEGVAVEVGQTADQFEIDVGRQLDFQEILAQANLELADFALPTQRNASEEAQQLTRMAKAEEFAQQSEHLTHELADPANRDDHTGAFNSGALDRFLAEQFERGRAAGRPLGLILVDLQHLDATDEAACCQEETVRIELARRLNASARDCDMVACTGGGRFVVVLPDTDLPAVQQAAVRLRRAAWDRAFRAASDGAHDTVAAAIGIGALSVGDFARARNPAHLLVTAGKLLAATRHLRNRTIGLVRI